MPVDLRCHTPALPIPHTGSALLPARRVCAPGWGPAQRKTRASGSMPQSLRALPARSRKIFSGTGCGISLLLSCKEINITAAADGLDALLIAVIRPMLAPQIAHMHVNAAVHGRHWPAQRSLRQVFSTDDFARITQEGIQKIKLRSCKHHRFAIACNAA